MKKFEAQRGYYDFETHALNAYREMVATKACKQLKDEYDSGSTEIIDNGPDCYYAVGEYVDFAELKTY